MPLLRSVLARKRVQTSLAVRENKTKHVIMSVRRCNISSAFAGDCVAWEDVYPVPK